jgi:hypothetical protein
LSTTRDATAGDGDGAGNAAVSAIPLPQVPRNTAAATRDVTTTSPRRIDQRIPSGAASAAAKLRTISATPKELPADALPWVASAIPMATVNMEKSKRKTARPAANQLPTPISFGQLVCGFAFAIHREPSQRHFPSAEMAGCHCAPSQKNRPSSDNLVVKCPGGLNYRLAAHRGGGDIRGTYRYICPLALGA